MKPLATLEEIRSAFNYDPDTGIITNRISRPHAPAGKESGCLRPDGYRGICFNGRIYLGHRIAWLLTNGEWPQFDTDHVNGKKDDNRIANLRVATRTENTQNVGRSVRNTSGFKGVSWSCVKSKWHARISSNGKVVNLGYYDNPQDAGAAYRAAAPLIHGNFARVEWN